MTLLALLLVASGSLVLRTARSERVADAVLSPNWQAGTWFRLDDRDTVTHCELPAGARYRLVVGCLGEAAEEFTVQLSLTTSVDQQNRGRSAEIPLQARVGPVSHTPSRPEYSAPQPDKSDQPLGTTRDFFLHVTDGDLDDPKQYARITARSVACGNRVRIFLDQQLPAGEVPQPRIEELLRTLETDVVPRIESQFGQLRDADQDGRFTVVLTPWLSQLQGGRTSIGGMVRSSDFQIDIPSPLGNRGDMLFLNSALPNEAALRDLLSHEVAHAACLSQRPLGHDGRFSDEEDWLSEALAHLAEPGWSNLDHRLAAFLEETSRFPLVVPDYYRAGLWRNPGCRGSTFLFTRWCIARHGPHLVRQLVESPTTGTRNFERATGRRFEGLFREWSLSLASGDELAAPDLRGVLNRLGSQGLRPTIFNGDGSREQTLRMRGTAFTVVELRWPSSESRTLKIVGDSAARWQFSISRIKEDSSNDCSDLPLVADRPR